MSLSRNTRRRLALYGGATLIAAALVAAPRLVVRFRGAVQVRDLDVKAALETEAVGLLREYLRIDTTNPPGRTTEAVAFWTRLLGCEGIPYEVVGDDPERRIVVARLAGRSREGALLLLHHMDVVSPGDVAKWQKPPFAAEMGTGESYFYLVGRGALDMKDLGIAHFLAMAQLKRDGIVPAHDVVFVAETGEETFDPSIGIGWILQHRPDLLAGVTDVFNEGGVNEVVTDHIARFGVEVLQKGIVSAYGYGKPADLKAFARSLEERMPGYPYHVTPEIEDFLAFIGPSRSDVWGRQMIDARKAIAAGRFNEGIPEVYRALLRDMYYTGDVQKSPDGDRMEVVATLLPGSPVAPRWREMQQWAAARHVTLRLRYLTSDSVATPRTGRAWDAVATVLGLDPEGAEVGIYVLTGAYTNCQVLRARGYRCYGLSTFNVNFTDAWKIHNVNERINVVYFVDGVERMKAIVREFATAP